MALQQELQFTEAMLYRIISGLRSRNETMVATYLRRAAEQLSLAQDYVRDDTCSTEPYGVEVADYEQVV